MSDALYLAVLLASVVAACPAQAGLFWLTARLLGSKRATVRRWGLTTALFLALAACWLAAFLLRNDLAILILFLLHLTALAALFRRSAALSRAHTAAALPLLIVLNGAFNIALALGLLRPTIAASYAIPDGSGAMSPTLEPGDRFLCDRTCRPERWSVVVFRSPLEPDTVYVGRLVGLPGETIEIRTGEVLVNGSVAPKPSNLAPVSYSTRPLNALCIGCEGAPVTLGPDECYILGDNTDAALDSRYWPGTKSRGPGMLPVPDLLGVARVRYAPRDRIGFIR